MTCCVQLLMVAAACGLQAAAQISAPVIFGSARFTLLSPRLVRMEYDGNATFDDRPTITITNRSVPVVAGFVTQISEDTVQISTDAMVIVYSKAAGAAPIQGFTPSNLQISATLSDGRVIQWQPGQPQAGNLRGTFSYLDCYAPPMECVQQYQGRIGDGLIALDGWNLLNDTGAMRLSPVDPGDPIPWNWWAPAPGGDYVDWYFHAFGKDFRGALKEISAFAGRPSLPPRAVFG